MVLTAGEYGLSTGCVNVYLYLRECNLEIVNLVAFLKSIYSLSVVLVLFCAYVVLYMTGCALKM